MRVEEKTAEDYMAVLHAEWEKRLERNEIDPDVYTRREVQKKTGMSEKKALSWMKELMEDGVAKPCFASRKDAWGRVQPTIPAIRFDMKSVEQLLEEANVSLRDSG